MTIFTEHNEVIMSLDNFRHLIRETAAYACNQSPDIPVTWIMEDALANFEKLLRKDNKALDTHERFESMFKALD